MGLLNKIFFILKTASHVSTTTSVWFGDKLLADPDRYCENTLFQELTDQLRSCQEWCALLQVCLLLTITLCLKNIDIKPKTCSSVGRILAFYTFLPLTPAYGCSAYLEYCFWLTIPGRNCLPLAALAGKAKTASMSLPNPFLSFTHLTVLGFLLRNSHLNHHSYNWKSH